MTLAFLAPLFTKAESVSGPKVTPKPEAEVLEHIAKAEALAKEKALVATFDPRELDARPVIWSLYHHPEEWVDHDGGRWLQHPGSGHYVSSFEMRAVAAECSCHNVYFQASQQGELANAETWWRYGREAGNPAPDYPAPTIKAGREADQFAGHFLR